jgi:hypothetical protein
MATNQSATAPKISIRAARQREKSEVPENQKLPNEPILMDTPEFRLLT